MNISYMKTCKSNKEFGKINLVPMLSCWKCLRHILFEKKLFFAENSWIQWYCILVSTDENSWNKNGNSVIDLIILMF